jgi:putative membrane protein
VLAQGREDRGFPAPPAAGELGRDLVMKLLARICVVALAIATTAALLPGIEIDGGVGALLWITVLFLGVNLLLKPIVSLLSLPFLALTLGLFAFVINTGLLLFTSWLTDNMEIDGVWPAFWGSLIISAVVGVLEAFLDGG